MCCYFENYAISLFLLGNIFVRYTSLESIQIVTSHLFSRHSFKNVRLYLLTHQTLAKKLYLLFTHFMSARPKSKNHAAWDLMDHYKFTRLVYEFATTRQVCHQRSNRPTVSPVANIVFAWNWFLFWKVGMDGWTDDMCKNNYSYRPWQSGSITNYVYSVLLRI